MPNNTSVTILRTSPVVCYEYWEKESYSTRHYSDPVMEAIIHNDFTYNVEAFVSSGEASYTTKESFSFVGGHLWWASYGSDGKMTGYMKECEWDGGESGPLDDFIVALRTSGCMTYMRLLYTVVSDNSAEVVAP